MRPERRGKLYPLFPNNQKLKDLYDIASPFFPPIQFKSVFGPINQVTSFLGYLSYTHQYDFRWSENQGSVKETLDR